MVQSLSTNTFGPAKWIVNADATKGTNTTIASAITAASSGDTIFIMPGTYTENLTLKAGVDLTAWPGDEADGNVTIVGTCTLTVATTVNISSIRLQTNSAALLAVTGNAASIINLNNCYLNCTNTTGITFSSSSASAVINLNSCNGDLGTTGIALFTHTSSGNLNFRYCVFTNSGASTTANTASAGGLAYTYSVFGNPITTSSTNSQSSQSSIISTANQNVTAFTCGNAGGSTNDLYASGSASAISVGGALGISDSIVNSTNTNAITGAGTLNYDLISFTGTSKLINTSTQSVFNGAAFTPVLAFGGASVGITYTTRFGRWYRVGNIVFININAVMSSKGSSTGAATITGLPYVSNADNVFIPITLIFVTQATATYYYSNIAVGTSSLTLNYIGAPTGAVGAVTDTMFINTSQFGINGFYYV